MRNLLRFPLFPFPIGTLPKLRESVNVLTTLEEEINRIRNAAGEIGVDQAPPNGRRKRIEEAELPKSAAEATAQITWSKKRRLDRTTVKDEELRRGRESLNRYISRDLHVERCATIERPIRKNRIVRF